MNYVDIVLGAILAFGVYRGFTRGFVISVFGALALFAGIYGGIHFSDYVAEWLTDSFDLTAEWIPFASFLLTFLAIIIAIHLLGKAITQALKMAMLGLVNKLAGAFFGLFKMALIVSVSLLILHPLNLKLRLINEESCEKSLLYRPMHTFASTLIPAILSSDFYAYLETQDWLPESVREQLNQSDAS